MTTIELRGIGKSYGPVNALRDVSTTIAAGTVTCVLGDNGAGKSTLIKILAGVHTASEGRFLIDGEAVTLTSPRDALERGIATVHQDLAVVPLLPVWRNFFLGAELTRGPLRRLDRAAMREITRRELALMGIELRDVDQTIGTLSGGERQSVAIARAVYFGARVLILDEPTAALGVAQSRVVLRYIRAARERGLAVVFITHNPAHALPVGDRFLVLGHGSVIAERHRDDVSLEELTVLMSGLGELDDLGDI